MELRPLGVAGEIVLPCRPTKGEFASLDLASLQCPIQGVRQSGNFIGFRTHPLNVQIFTEKELAIAAAAEVLFCHLKRNPSGVTGTATGNTYTPIWNLLAAKIDDHRNGGAELVLRDHRLFQLDEYLWRRANGTMGPIDPQHPLSYRRYVTERVSDPFGVPSERKVSNAQWGNTWVPSPDEGEPLGHFCLRYETARTEAGVQLQCLGLGQNGHIAFIEPTTGRNADLLFWTETRVVMLSESTQFANFGKLNPEIPAAVSVGIQSILRSQEVVLVALGSAKADALKAMVEGPVGPHCPASYLRLLPPDRVKIIVDEEAASKLAGTVAAR